MNRLPSFLEWQRQATYALRENESVPSLMKQFGQYIEFAGNFFAKEAFEVGTDEHRAVLDAIEHLGRSMGEAATKWGMKMVNVPGRFPVSVIAHGPNMVSDLFKTLEVRTPEYGYDNPLNMRSTLGVKAWTLPNEGLENYFCFVTQSYAECIEKITRIEAENAQLRQRLYELQNDEEYDPEEEENY